MIPNSADDMTGLYFGLPYLCCWNICLEVWKIHWQSLDVCNSRFFSIATHNYSCTFTSPSFSSTFFHSFFSSFLARNEITFDTFFNRSFSPLDIYVLYQILSSTALKGCLSLNLRLKHNVFLNFTYLLIALRLCCCPWAFSSFCGEWGPLSSCNAPVSYSGGFCC